MESIGSVGAIIGRTNSDNSSGSKFSDVQRKCDPRAEQTRQCNGQEAYEEYLEQSAACKVRQMEQDREEALQKIARKARIQAIARRIVRVEAMVERKIGKVISKIARKTSRCHIRP